MKPHRAKIQSIANIKSLIYSPDLGVVSKYIPKNDNIIDVIIHGDGSKFIIEGKAYSAGDIAKRIQESLVGNDDPIRLLSCSDLKSAKEFSKHFPNRDIIATEAIVRIHADGGITTVAKSGNGTQTWYQLRDGKSIKEYKNTKSSSKINDYVELGAKKSPLPDDLYKLINEKYPNLLPKIDDQLGELLVKAGSGKLTVLKQLNSWSPETLSLLSKDLKDNAKFAKEFSKSVGENAGLVETWKVIQTKPKLRKDIKSLTAVTNLRKNAKFKELGLTDELLGDIVGAEGLAYASIINNLDDFGKNIVGKNIELKDFYKLLSDLKQGGGKSDGANWIIEYLGNKAEDFSGKKLQFEFYTNNSGKRFVDVADITNSKTNKIVYYEFKSVKEVPPGHFNEQFIKDLNNAQSLDDIKWIFNGAKDPPNFKENMINAIDGLPLTDEILLKYNKNRATKLKDIDELKDLIESKFDSIFKLVDLL